MISFKNVTKKYGNSDAAVKSMTLDIQAGEFFVIIGPSGCGKTTALKMINRLIPLTDGTLFINGKKVSEYNVHELRWNIGYVLQQIALFPHMTIEENVAVVPELKNWSRDKIRARVDELLQMVGLAPDTYRNRKPKELSGGQQQRVGVVRALAADPEIILMDEPFSALDPITREKLQDDMLSLQNKIKKTIVFVTHDMQEALKLGDRICVMRDGEVIQLGTPEEIVQNPANDFVREFVGVQRQPYLSLEELVIPSNETMNDVSAAIPSSASLKETLSFLADDEAIFVEKDGQVIGTINRQRIIQHLAVTLPEEGRVNE